jgi:hypothetical protein
MKRVCLAAILVAALLLVLLPATPAGAVTRRAAAVQISENGIGDWQNSYPWSMIWFNGDLYVGTGRLGCTSSVMSMMTGPMSGGTLPLPGGTPPPRLNEFLSADMMTVTDSAKYAAFTAVTQAEIWRLHCGQWERVYQAPMVPSYLSGPGMPYMAPEIMGFRSVAVFTDASGVKAMYMAAGGFTFAYHQPLMMRSTDGVNWTPVYAPPAMGRESRALGVHHGKLYVGVGSGGVAVGGVGAGVWCSATPTDPASWTNVLEFPTLDATNSCVLSFASFYGRVYAGTENRNGFQVWRSKVADPAGNGDWKRVVDDGAGHPGNGWAGTMRVFNGRLYVGSMSIPGLSGPFAVKGFDLIRISPWDTWALVVGDPRTVATPWGERTLKPLSGQMSGMGNPVNLYCWSLEVHGGRLYLGTFDASTFLMVARDNGIPMGEMLGLTPEQIDALAAGAGGDLYRSWDGVNYRAVTRTGFGDPYNYGVRNMVSRPLRLYLGFSNPFFGCEMWVMRGLW